MTEEAATAQRRPDRPLSPLGIGVVGATIIVDQATKLVAERSLEFEQPIDLLPILSLYRVHNTGIAFSLLSDFGGIGLIAMALVVTGLVLAIWQRTTDGGRLVAVGYALIIGGALGNLADRLFYGHVVDFLLLHLGERPIFVFNLADAALTLGPALLIAVYFLPAGRSPDRAP
jgi:signal peptidase II